MSPCRLDDRHHGGLAKVYLAAGLADCPFTTHWTSPEDVELDHQAGCFGLFCPGSVMARISTGRFGGRCIS
jgi:hypothetical protein